MANPDPLGRFWRFSPSLLYLHQSPLLNGVKIIETKTLCLPPLPLDWSPLSVILTLVSHPKVNPSKGGVIQIYTPKASP